jgi:hypothetical protein
MAVTNASAKGKTVADPTAAYESIRPLWDKSRAICNGERFVKDYDGILDPYMFSNLLLPFSPSMTQEQYNFYKAEAELPGIVAMYAKILVGGLLRKQPQLELPDDAPEEAYQWIMDAFTQDSNPLVSFLDTALWEEMQTSRAWIYVDYPRIPNADELTTEEFQEYKPYPILWNAESIINWRMGTSDSGKQKLTMVITRNYVEEADPANEFHPKLIDTVWVHELVNNKYQIRKYQRPVEDGMVPVVNGKIQQQYGQKASEFKLVDTITNILANGKPLDIIPAWPLNGAIQPVEPLLTPLQDKEIALYNKMSRRNHLLYGASTYTPVVKSGMSDEEFQAIVQSGLGTWIKVGQDDDVTVLATPTEALADMDRAIAAAIEEMARLGIRLLAAETDQSGVALEIRNAAQTAQLGTLNVKISNQLADIIAFMLNWRYDRQYTSSDVEFTLSADFNPTPLGADWLRLVTEWYQTGLIPRTVWLQILKINDIIPPDYDDEEGQKEVNDDELIITPKEQADYAQEVELANLDLQAQALAQKPAAAPAKPAAKKGVK